MLLQEIVTEQAKQDSTSVASKLFSRLSKRLTLPHTLDLLPDSTEPSGEASTSASQGAHDAKKRKLCDNTSEIAVQTGDVHSTGLPTGNRVVFKGKGAHIVMPVASIEVHSRPSQHQLLAPSTRFICCIR